VLDHPPFGNNPTFKKCELCKSQAICGSKGKCLLKASKEFTRDYSGLLMLFSLKPEDRSRADRRRKGKFLPKKLTQAKPPLNPLPAGNSKVGDARHTIHHSRIPGSQGVDGSVIPAKTLKKITDAQSKTIRQIKKEKAKIAAATQGEVSKATIRGKNIKPGASMDISPPDGGTVITGKTGDPVPQDPPKKGNTKRVKEERKKERDSNPKRKKRKKRKKILQQPAKGNAPISGKFNPPEEQIRNAMKLKKLNRRGAISYLRKIFFRK
jgi:hypothetical protein